VVNGGFIDQDKRCFGWSSMLMVRFVVSSLTFWFAESVYKNSATSRYIRNSVSVAILVIA